MLTSQEESLNVTGQNPLIFKEGQDFSEQFIIVTRLIAG
jgi:hypothetical protein